MQIGRKIPSVKYLRNFDNILPATSLENPDQLFTVMFDFFLDVLTTYQLILLNVSYGILKEFSYGLLMVFLTVYYIYYTVTDRKLSFW